MWHLGKLFGFQLMTFLYLRLLCLLKCRISKENVENFPLQFGPDSGKRYHHSRLTESLLNEVQTKKDHYFLSLSTQRCD
jgi:hypothetical protein